MLRKHLCHCFSILILSEINQWYYENNIERTCIVQLYFLKKYGKKSFSIFISIELMKSNFRIVDVLGEIVRQFRNEKSVEDTISAKLIKLIKAHQTFFSFSTQLQSRVSEKMRRKNFGLLSSRVGKK